MRVTNPTDRPIIAKVNAGDPNEVDDLKWIEIPAGESIDVENYRAAATLVEYGAVASKDDLDAALAAWAEGNRQQNSRLASASASEGVILGRQQATVSVVDGTVLSGEGLKGADLDRAVRQANEDGANIKASASADEKRDALAAWQATRGASTPPAGDPGLAEYETDEDGNLVLDDEGQPIPKA